MRQGRVAVIGAAPPCETWTIARFADVAQKGVHDRSMPVPLRRKEQLWGRSDLTMREHRQVRTANVLLIFAIAYATLATFYGIDMWIEHPDILPSHTLKGAPSIWFLEQLSRLEKLPTTSVHHCPHSRFGGRSHKPTRLFAVRLPTLALRLKQWEYKARVLYSLREKNADGSWRTSRAKEYPRRLSAAIAFAMIDALKRASVSLSDHSLSQFHEQIAPYMPQLSSAQEEEIGSDFVDSVLPISKFATEWHPPLAPLLK